MQEQGEGTPYGHVTALLHPQDPIAELAARFQASGLTYLRFARQEGVNHGLIWNLQQQLIAGRLRWSGVLAGPGWQTVTLAFQPEAEASYPHYLVSVYPPRKCDVTGDWFVPTDHRQRFRPGLSEAVKRAARRDLSKARRKYATHGDWGQ